MCKKQISILLSLVALCLFTGGCRQSEFDRLADGFRNPDDSVRLRMFWYWMSDNVSQEGIERDLEAIKAAGIGSVFIGNIGGEGVPYGKVKLLSDEWWAALHTAMKKASELDIEVGMFNSPGWSQSGGPWIKPQQSMRRLASSSAQVEGGKHVSLKLASPGNEAQDVRVVAYPVLPQNAITEKTIKVNKEQGKSLTVDFHFERPVTVRSFIYSTAARMWTTAELLVKEGSEYRSIKKMMINRTNHNPNVGFIRHAPVVGAIPEAQSSDFRLWLGDNGAGEADITLSTVPYMERYPEKVLGKMFQDAIPSWDSYMWDVQPEAIQEMYIPVERVIDLTDKMSAEGIIEWDAPEGLWTVSRVAMITTGVTNAPASPEGKGLEVDKMNSKHVASHFDAFIGEVLRRIPAKDRRTFRLVVADSYETGGQNWTDGMLERFTKTYGYSPVPYFPVFDGNVVGSRELSDRFLWDLRRLVADMISYGYVAGLKKVANEHGLTLWLQNYGHWGYPGEFLQYGGQSDEVSGEFWTGSWGRGVENRAASSSAHIYGKRKTWAESCTSGGPYFWLYPGTLKIDIDRSFIEGINATLLSTYQHQAYEDWNPGINAWFGMEFNRKNTWFGKMNGFTDYLRSCNLMLQEGNYVADVAYFIGEDAPKMTGITSPELPHGYSYDFINAEVLMTRASMQDGKLALPDGMHYNVLVLPPVETMRPEVLQRISNFVNEGLTIVGQQPKRSPSLVNYPKADGEVAALASKLWADGNEKVRKVGRGQVFSADASLDEVFASLNLPPDFSLASSPKTPALHIHRRLKDGDIYFVTNQSDKPVNFTPEFRVAGRAVELWNPVTREISPAVYSKASEQTTAVQIDLPANGSVFVVFRNKANENISTKQHSVKYETLLTLSNPWKVTFEKGRGAPEEPVTFNKLEDWSKSSDERIRYFSGTATYETTFDIDKLPNEQAYIDLENVMVVARVKLNGKSIGNLWTAPYRLRIDKALKKGTNLLEIEVANSWANKLIGDSRLPNEQRITRTVVNHYKSESKLQASGLIGSCNLIVKKNN
ncbi:MAG: glycoside hydrolase family 2 [Prevotellaceae bacterium]|jgi:hypothetical protein|nr:glycoside hydrolase family 2 [Prevotellaceae bacterium]